MDQQATGAPIPRAPVQARSRAALERLLDAAEQQFSETGYDATTIGAIARRARVSVGAVYTRFADKGALFAAVQERYKDRILAEWDAALASPRWRDAPLAEVVAGVVAEMAGIAGRHGGFIRAFAVRAMVDRDVGARAVAITQGLAVRLAPLLLARRAAITHPDPAFAVDFGFRAVLATLQQVVFYGGAVPTARAVQIDQLVPDLTRLYLAYLTASPDSAPQSQRQPAAHPDDRVSHTRRAHDGEASPNCADAE